jgi:hypothetical protein
MPMHAMQTLVECGSTCISWQLPPTFALKSRSFGGTLMAPDNPGG